MVSVRVRPVDQESFHIFFKAVAQTYLKSKLVILGDYVRLTESGVVYVVDRRSTVGYLVNNGRRSGPYIFRFLTKL